MNPSETALLALIAFGTPFAGICLLIIKWQLQLDAMKRSHPKPGIKPAE